LNKKRYRDETENVKNQELIKSQHNSMTKKLQNLSNNKSSLPNSKHIIDNSEEERNNGKEIIIKIFIYLNLFNFQLN